MTNKTRSVTHQEFLSVASLGRQIKISPKARVIINKPGLKREFFTETIDVLIGIGKNSVAHLSMDMDAWHDLKQNEPINIETLKQFKKKIK